MGEGSGESMITCSSSESIFMMLCASLRFLRGQRFKKALTVVGGSSKSLRTLYCEDWRFDIEVNILR